MSLKELASSLELGYYTVREATYNLLQEGKIVITGSDKRTRIYGLSASERIKDTLPYITNILTRQQYKVVSILAAVGNEEEMAAVGAVKSMPELFDVNKKLDELKSEMQQSFLAIKNASFILEQVLNDPRCWSPQHLKEFVDDPDYIYIDIVKAVEHYA
jgi:hypothetical protein